MVQGGRANDLERLLADDVVFWADGGGKAPATPRPLHSPVAVARFLAGLVRRGAPLGFRLEPTHVNGEPGLLTIGPSGELLGALSMTFDEQGQVIGLRNQINPDKLRHLGEVGDLTGLMHAD